MPIEDFNSAILKKDYSAHIKSAKRDLLYTSQLHDGQETLVSGEAPPEGGRGLVQYRKIAAEFRQKFTQIYGDIENDGLFLYWSHDKFFVLHLPKSAKNKFLKLINDDKIDTYNMTNENVLYFTNPSNVQLF